MAVVVVAPRPSDGRTQRRGTVAGVADDGIPFIRGQPTSVRHGPMAYKCAIIEFIEEEGFRMSRALGGRMDDAITIRPIEAADRDWVVRFLRDRWGTDRMAAHGVLFCPADHPGFVAVRLGGAVGLLTYALSAAACEITLIDSGIRHVGIGTALIAAVKEAATQAGCTRLWLVTTNDNVDALRFYQRRGFALVGLRPNAMQAARTLKPEIPLIGQYGIPLRDELELEMTLT